MAAHAAALALSQLLAHCAPNVGARTMSAIVAVESGGEQLAIHDNTDRRALHPPNLTTALGWANYLLVHRHSIDLGLAQINSANLPRLGITVRGAFDPCTNLRGASTILSYDYGRAIDLFGPGQFALRRALAAYNSGSLFAGRDYVERILLAAGIDPQDDERVPDLDGRQIAARPVPPPVRVVVVRHAAPPRPRSNGVAPAASPIVPQNAGILVRVDHVALPTPQPEAADADAPIMLNWSRDRDAHPPAPVSATSAGVPLPQPAQH
ncbi:MAG: lytic transglycosylase domain-containing protein [Candidatus Eremiobacteraeota bacterium]|nr:lytic transglycosylase domain-containing protein [Candidatus Eremiobacteraeota bacterium]MBV9407317.1 lytic transglycosylase domain-containing protein [Candidatus Eremiobacteraeota bacterium]